MWLTCSLALHTALDLQRVPVLERESLTDPVTGLYNRRYLERRLDQEFARARRHALPLAVLRYGGEEFIVIASGRRRVSRAGRKGRRQGRNRVVAA